LLNVWLKKFAPPYLITGGTLMGALERSLKKEFSKLASLLLALARGGWFIIG
jgi:hypothetical protein